MTEKGKHRVSNDPVPGSLRAILPGYRDMASELAGELGIDLDHASRRVRTVFESSIIAKYRDTIDRTLASQTHTNRVALALKLAKDKGTRSRWKSGEREPDWDSLFLGLAAFDVDIGPSIPRGREVVIHALRMTIPVLRVEYLNGTEETLSEGQLVCLHYVTQSMAWSLARDTEKQKHWQTAFEYLRPRILQFASGVEITNCSDIASYIEGWTLSWCVFHYLVPHDWQYKGRSDGVTP